MAENTQVPAKQSPAGPPDYLRTGKNLGTENMTNEDIVIPRLKICQGLSEIHKTNKEIKDGDYYNSLTNEIVVNPTFFVLAHWKTTVWFEARKLAAIQVWDAENGAYSIVGPNPEVAQRKEGDKNFVEPTQAQNYMLVLGSDVQKAIKKGEMPMPIIMSCQSAGIRAARKLNGKLKTNGLQGVPIYGQAVSAVTVEEKFTDGNAFMPVFSFGRYATEDEFKFLTKMAESCANLQKRAEANIEGHEPEEGDAPVNPQAKKVKDMFT